jgi:hypothetical protein
VVIYALWRGLLYFTRYFTASVYPQIPGTGRTAKKSKRSSFSIHSNILEQSPEGHTSHPVRSARSSLRSLFCGQKTTHTPASQAGSTEDGSTARWSWARWAACAASYCSIVSYCIPWALLAWHAASSGCWLVDAGRSSEGTSQP